MSTIDDMSRDIEQFGVDMDIVNRWVQGGPSASVSIGGVQTPTIRNIVDKLVASGGAIAYQTLAMLNADLAHAANTLAFVTNDGSTENNGWYIKVGASGSGSWKKSTYDAVSNIRRLEEAVGLPFLTESYASPTGGTKNFPIEAGCRYRFFFKNCSGVGVFQCYVVTADGGTRYLGEMADEKSVDVITQDGDTHFRVYAARADGASSIEYTIIGYKDEEWTLESRIAKIEQGAFAVANSTSRIFRRVICCGSSTTSGFVRWDYDSSKIPQREGDPGYEVSGDNVYFRRDTNEKFAWPYYMSIITGGSYLNCGVSGANTFTWQTATRGLVKATADASNGGIAQAYMVQLGVNDALGIGGPTTRVTLGTASDIPAKANLSSLGNDVAESARTFYKGVSQVLYKLHALNPYAHLFWFTDPKVEERAPEYNRAIEEVISKFRSYGYKAHLVDVARVCAHLYDLPSYKGDLLHAHTSAIGYAQKAEIFNYAVSRYINEHITEFQEVFALPFAEPNS